MQKNIEVKFDPIPEGANHFYKSKEKELSK